MRRVKIFLFFFSSVLIYFAYSFFNPKPDTRICNYLIAESLSNPLFYDYAVKIGCSNRRIVFFLNSHFKVSSSFDKNKNEKDNLFKELLDAGFSELEIRQYFAEENKKFSN